MLVKIQTLNLQAHNQLLNNLIDLEISYLVRGSAVIFNFLGEDEVYRNLWTGLRGNIIQQGITESDRNEYFKIA